MEGKVSQKLQLTASTSPVWLTVSPCFDAAPSVCSLNQAIPVIFDGCHEHLFCYPFAASIYLLLVTRFFFFLSFLLACCVLNKVTHSPDCIEWVSSCLVSAEGPGNNTLRILRDKCTVKLSSTLINEWNFYKSKQECRLLFCHLFVGIVSQ